MLHCLPLDFILKIVSSADISIVTFRPPQTGIPGAYSAAATTATFFASHTRSPEVRVAVLCGGGSGDFFSLLLRENSSWIFARLTRPQPRVPAHNNRNPCAAVVVSQARNCRFPVEISRKSRRKNGACCDNQQDEEEEEGEGEGKEQITEEEPVCVCLCVRSCFWVCAVERPQPAAAALVRESEEKRSEFLQNVGPRRIKHRSSDCYAFGR